MPSTKVRRGLYWSDYTKTWHYEFRLKLDGQTKSRKFNGDTGHVLEDEARTWLEAKKKRLKEQAVGLAAPDGPGAPTLEEALRQWLAEANRAGARHRDIVRSSIETHMGPELKTPLPHLTKPVVDLAVARYLAGAHKGRKHTEGGANVLLRALKCVALHAVKAGRIQAVPFPGVAMLQPHPRPRHALRTTDLDRLLQALQELQAPQQATDLVILMAGLGLRVTEACTARVEAFDARRRVFTPWDPLLGTKGHSAVQLPVPSWVYPHLVRLAGDRHEGYLVQGARGERPTRALASKWVKKARERLRWPWLTPHELRACYATFLSEEGVAPQVIQRLLRHKHLKTTEKYLRHDMDQAREALERIGQKAGLVPKMEGPEPELSPSSPRRFRIVRIN